MTTENPTNPRRSVFLKNWLVLGGFVVAAGSLFSFFLLFLLDSLAAFSNPYVGILTYLVAPGFLVFGLALTAAGFWWERRRLKKGGAVMPLRIDFSQPRDRKRMGIFLVAAIAFLFISAIGSYHSYHFTESVQFCGQTCHTVMEPEMTTYQHSPHARVACVECHIGPGATWFVRSKLSGTYQVYAVLANKYPRPIPTPVENLRPARDTCEQCHWPEKFTGNLDRTYSYILGDETNTPYTLRMAIKVGGSDPTAGPVSGIHWHMSVANKVEYIATDRTRQTIPWVRLTDRQGVVSEFRTPDFTNDISQFEIRTMDCIDCHNRPAHIFETPNHSVDLAIALGRMDGTLPWLQTNAVYALTRSYTNKVQALESIATFLAGKYPDQPGLNQTIATVQEIYGNNFFPQMNAQWKDYPDNSGHLNWAGCFRCHDGKHQTVDGSRTIQASDCNSCHTILAQGIGAELEQITPAGQPFRHPGGELEEGWLCSDCHDGTF